MDDQSNLHNPRLDDELDREVQSLTHGAPSLVTELPDAEAGDELDGGLSHGELLARSDLAVHLRPSIFPAGRDAILECATEERAPTDLLGQLRAIPDREYATVQQVWEALGGKREEREHVPPVERAPSSPSDERFGFRFDGRYRIAALPFGVAPSSAHVDVTTDDGGERVLIAHFGPWSVTTPVSNVAGTATGGPYSLVKTAGPAHVSLKDFGLTFATNGERGLCIRFRRSVPGLEPTGLVRHPALTVTVDDVEGLERALRS